MPKFEQQTTLPTYSVSYNIDGIGSVVNTKLDFKAMKEASKRYVEDHQLAFVHVRAWASLSEDGPEESQFGGCTVCYSLADIGSSQTVMLPIAVSWCKDSEPYNKVIGRYVSSKNWVHSETILLKLNNRLSIPDQIAAFFHQVV